jgi:hypothetical protein
LFGQRLLQSDIAWLLRKINKSDGVDILRRGQMTKAVTWLGMTVAVVGSTALASVNGNQATDEEIAEQRTALAIATDRRIRPRATFAA